MFRESKELNQRLKEDGYVKISVLSQQEIEALASFYESSYPTPQSGFHSTHFLKDRDLKKAVQNKILSTFEAAFGDKLKGYEPLFANFMVKPTGEGSTMPLHADWTYVDEEKFQSFGVWCPLVDTNMENGMLGVVPKSHKFKTNFRGPQIPSPFNEFNEYIIENFGKLIPMKAGEAIVYSHKLLHFSPPNLSDNPRVAVNIVLRPKQASTMHYASFGNYPEVVLYQNTKPSFYLEYDHFEKPSQGTPVKVAAPVKGFSKEYIDKVLGTTGSFLDRLKKIFS